MQRQRTAFLLTFGTILAIGLSGSTVQSQQAEPKDEQSVNSKATKAPQAAAIDFKKQLGLPFGSLGSLGSRIDAARRTHNAVGLANAANELSVAEKVSGKKATLTSSAVIKEAAELASLKRQASELQAVQRVAEQVASEADLVANLKKEITLSQDQAKLETNAIRRGEEPTDAPRKVLVNNYTTQYVDIWLNGFLKIQVGPGESKWFTIEHKWNPTVLKAYGNEDDMTWGPRYIWGKFKTYTWNLN